MASGDQLLIFGAQNGEPPGADFATLDARNNHPVLDFDDTTQEAIFFTGVMPAHYGGGGVTVEVHWAASTATTGTIGWDVAFERTAVVDIDADGFATAKTITALTVPATSGEPSSSAVSFAAGSEMSGVVVGDLFRIKVRRNVASDTATGDAELLAVELRET